VSFQVERVEEVVAEGTRHEGVVCINAAFCRPKSHLPCRRLSPAPLSFVLSQVRLDLGFAMGLFAVFGILRYRTESIEVRDLTYLFVVIGLAVLNALVTPSVSLWQLLFVNAVIVGMVALLESASFSRREESRRVVYDRLDLLAEGRASELLADLRTRTQLQVERCEIGSVDLLRDTASLMVFFERAEESRDAARERPCVAGQPGEGTAV